MTIDRSAFRATPVVKLEEQSSKINKILGSSGNRAENLTLDEGENKIRIYPARENEKSFIYLRSVVFLPQEIEWEGKTEIKLKPIFNSRVHGNTPKDIVEEYVKFSIAKIMENSTDQRETETKISYLNGFRDSRGKFNSGLNFQNKWVCYIDKHVSVGKQFGTLDITPGTKDKLIKLAAIEAADEPLVTDPYTDLDNGVCVIITVDPKAKPADYYSVRLEEVKEKLSRRLVPTPLTDSDLENFLKYPSLESLYVNSYKRSDFEKAINGLKIFDEKNKIGTFQYDAWFDIVDEIDAYYPGTDIKEEDIQEKEEMEHLQTTVEPQRQSYPTARKVEVEVEGDMFDEMDRQDLKLYIKANRLPITVKPDYSDSQIRYLIRDIELENEEIANATNSPESISQVQPESFPLKNQSSEPITNSEVKNKLDSIRNKFNRK